MEPFIGQIIMFAGTFAPRGWALCDGQLLDIARHPTLFSLLGTTYGGDGRTSFALPDLRGRVAVHAGAGPGLTARRPGDRMGAEQVRLVEAQMPAHGHELLAANRPGNSDRPSQAMLAQGGSFAQPGAMPGPVAALAQASVGTAGQGAPHENMPPGLCVSFIIALDGVCPSRG